MGIQASALGVDTAGKVHHPGNFFQRRGAVQHPAAGVIGKGAEPFGQCLVQQLTGADAVGRSSLPFQG